MLNVTIHCELIKLGKTQEDITVKRYFLLTDIHLSGPGNESWPRFFCGGQSLFVITNTFPKVKNRCNKHHIGVHKLKIIVESI